MTETSKKMKLRRKMKILGVPVNRKNFIEWKVYFDRARMYLSYINFVMIAYVFLNTIEDVSIRGFLDEYKFIIYPAVMMLFIFISMALGWLDTRLGMRQEELRNYANANPVMMEILSSVNDLKEGLMEDGAQKSSKN